MTTKMWIACGRSALRRAVSLPFFFSQHSFLSLPHFICIHVIRSSAPLLLVLYNCVCVGLLLIPHCIHCAQGNEICAHFASFAFDKEIEFKIEMEQLIADSRRWAQYTRHRRLLWGRCSRFDKQNKQTLAVKCLPTPRHWLFYLSQAPDSGQEARTITAHNLHRPTTAKHGRTRNVLFAN